MGESLIKQSKYEEALAHLREAQSLFITIAVKDPNNGGWQRDVALTYRRIGDVIEELARVDETLDSYRESFQRTKVLVAKEPDNSVWQRDLVLVIKRLAGVFLALGKPEEALHYLEEPARFAADDTAILWVRGRAALFAGRVAAAVDDFAALTKIEPANPYALLWLHIARQRAGQDDKQEFEANAATLDPHRWPWPILALYLGTESADGVFAAAKAASPANSQTRLCDADVYVAADRLAHGDQREARRLFEAAVEDCSDRDRNRAFAIVELARLDALASSHARP
jgi:tetratricopeptide (TPR) repeat protein